MQPMTPSGIPLTMICEGRERNGNGTSEPMTTNGLSSG
jgi:hypothetical protein